MNDSISQNVSLLNDNFDLFVTVCVFVITFDKEEVIVCYDATELKEKERLFETPEPGIFHYYKLNKTEYKKTYRLFENENKSKYYQIEFAWEPYALAEAYYDSSYSAEEYSEVPSLIHKNNIHEKMNIVNNGRRVLLMYQNSSLEKDIIFNMYLFMNDSNYYRHENSSVGFMMKWKPLENQNDYWDYQNLFENGHKFTIFRKNRNEANVSFTNYFFNNVCSECSSKKIIFSLYSKNKLKNVNFVNNIYTLEQPAILTKTYKDEDVQNAESFSESLELKEEDCCERFAAAQVYFVNTTTNEEVWLSYNSTILMDPPKIISTQEPRKYNYIDITKDDKYFTILLTKENYNDTLLYFELSYSSINVNNLNIITEKYKDNPTFEQATDIKCISTNISNNGKNSYLFKMPTLNLIMIY